MQNFRKAFWFFFISTVLFLSGCFAADPLKLPDFDSCHSVFNPEKWRNMPRVRIYSNLFDSFGLFPPDRADEKLLYGYIDKIVRKIRQNSQLNDDFKKIGHFL